MSWAAPDTSHPASDLTSPELAPAVWAVAIGVLAQETSWQGNDDSGRFRITIVAVRADDRWLATWSRAEAVIAHPIDPVALAKEVAALMRSRARSLPTGK